MSFSEKRRFIAGAVCPKCSEMDKIVAYSKEGSDYRECVSCGYVDKMVFQNNQQELDTRVNQIEEKVKEETQVLQFEPMKKH